MKLTQILENPALTLRELLRRNWPGPGQYAYDAEMARLAVPAAIAWAESAYFSYEQLAIIKLRLAIEPTFLPYFLEQMKHGKRHEIVL